MDIEIKHVLDSIVESMFPNFSDRSLGMLIMIDCSYSNYEKEIERRFPLYYLFRRSSNYTAVFMLDGRGSDEFRSPPSISDVIGKADIPWKLTSYHDSCWRSDGLCDLFNIECETMKDFGGYPVTPKKVHIFNTLGGLGSGIRFVEISDYRVDREKTIQNVIIKRSLTMQEAAELMPKKQ